LSIRNTALRASSATASATHHNRTPLASAFSLRTASRNPPAAAGEAIAAKMLMHDAELTSRYVGDKTRTNAMARHWLDTDPLSLFSQPPAG
jgi:hypothetical protein